MQKLHQRQRSDAQTQLKLLSEQNKSIENLVECLRDIPSIDEQVISFEKEATNLCALETRIIELSEFIQQYSIVSLETKLETLRLAILEELPLVPTLSSTEYIQSVIQAWDITQVEYSSLSEMTNILVRLPDVLVLEDTSAMLASIQSWHDQAKRLNSSRSLLEGLATLTLPRRSH